MRRGADRRRFTPRAWGLFAAAFAAITRGVFYLPSLGGSDLPAGLTFLEGVVPLGVIAAVWLTVGVIALASVLTGRMTAGPHFAVTALFAGWGLGYAIGFAKAICEALPTNAEVPADGAANFLFFGYLAVMTAALIRTEPPLRLPRWLIRGEG